MNLRRAQPPNPKKPDLFLYYDFADVKKELEASAEYQYLVGADQKAMANMAGVLGKSEEEMRDYCSVGSNAFFSERVTYLKSSAQAEQRIMLLQGSFLYFFNPVQLNFLSNIPISLIQRVYLIKHTELVLLRIKSYHNYLLRATHRVELLLFLVHHFARMEIRVPKIQECDLSLIDMVSSEFIGNPQRKDTKLVKLSKQFVKSGGTRGIKYSIVAVDRDSRSGRKKREWEDAVVILTKVGVKVFRSFNAKSSHFYPTFNSRVRCSSRIQQEEMQSTLQIESAGAYCILILFFSREEGEAWKEEIKKLQAQYQEEEEKALGLTE